MAEKEFKTIEKQISLLKSRGLNVPDETVAGNFLLFNNYYRVSGYSLTLRNHDIFYPRITFQNIMDIYCFDHEFRHLLLHFIKCIEVSVKSVYVYEFSKVHGPTGYLDPCHFTDACLHAKIIRKIAEQRDKRHPHEAYLKHFIDDLGQDIPLWACVDLMTISNISFIYKISAEPIKKAVAAHYALTMNTGHVILAGFMHSMTIIRNLCAMGFASSTACLSKNPPLTKKNRRY